MSDDLSLCKCGHFAAGSLRHWFYNVSSHFAAKVFKNKLAVRIIILDTFHPLSELHLIAESATISHKNPLETSFSTAQIGWRLNKSGRFSEDANDEFAYQFIPATFGLGLFMEYFPVRITIYKMLARGTRQVCEMKSLAGKLNFLIRAAIYSERHPTSDVKSRSWTSIHVFT